MSAIVSVEWLRTILLINTHAEQLFLYFFFGFGFLRWFRARTFRLSSEMPKQEIHIGHQNLKHFKYTLIHYKLRVLYVVQLKKVANKCRWLFKQTPFWSDNGCHQNPVLSGTRCQIKSKILFIRTRTMQDTFTKSWELRGMSQIILRKVQEQCRILWKEKSLYRDELTFL